MHIYICIYLYISVYIHYIYIYIVCIYIYMVGGFKHFLFSISYMGYIILPIDELHHFSRWLKHVETTKQISMQSLPAKIDHASIRFFLAARPNGLFSCDSFRVRLPTMRFVEFKFGEWSFPKCRGYPYSYHPFLIFGFSMK